MTNPANDVNCEYETKHFRLYERGASFFITVFNLLYAILYQECTYIIMSMDSPYSLFSQDTSPKNIIFEFQPRHPGTL